MRSGAKSFSIKNGHCYLYADRIEIVRSDVLGRLTQFLFRRGYQRARVLYLLLSLVLAIATVLSLAISNYFLVLFFGIMTLLGLYASQVNRSVSFAPIIPKRSIEKVHYRKAVQGEARAAFIVHFRPENRLLKRIIPLPTRSHNGNSLADAAYWIMRDEGLVE